MLQSHVTVCANLNGAIYGTATFEWGHLMAFVK